MCVCHSESHVSNSKSCACNAFCPNGSCNTSSRCTEKRVLQTWAYGLKWTLTITKRRFHHTTEVIPRPPSGSLEAPSASRPPENIIKRGDARGASEVRRGTSANHSRHTDPQSSSFAPLIERDSRLNQGFRKRGWRTEGVGARRSFLCQRFRPLFCTIFPMPP